MKSIKLSLICTTTLLLAIPFAGCMGGGDSGNASNDGVEQRIETQLEENEVCPDGKCPDIKRPDCNDGNCDKLPENRDGNGETCPDGKCPAKRMPHDQHRNGRPVPLPAPHRG